MFSEKKTLAQLENTDSGIRVGVAGKKKKFYESKYVSALISTLLGDQTKPTNKTTNKFGLGRYKRRVKRRPSSFSGHIIAFGTRKKSQRSILGMAVPPFSFFIYLFLLSKCQKCLVWPVKARTHACGKLRRRQLLYLYIQPTWADA